MQVNEVILAYGHRNVLASHESTLEITKEKDLSTRGDCIVAVSANKGMSDLSADFVRALRQRCAKVTLLIKAGEIAETVNAVGNPTLVLAHPTEIVVRRSSYICNRTLAIQADKAACDLSRKLVERLKDPAQKVKIELTVSI